MTGGELVERLTVEGERLDEGRDYWVPAAAPLADMVARRLATLEDAALHECRRICEEHPYNADKIIAAVERGITKCESPIEAILLPWLVGQAYSFLFDYNPQVLFAGEGDQLCDNGLAIIPQLPIGNFRVDFAVAMRRYPFSPRFVIVECDGAEFHDADKDAVRDLVIRGNSRVAAIVRLTGSEITREPADAALKVARAVRRAWRVRH